MSTDSTCIDPPQVDFRWPTDLRVGDWVFDRSFDHWGEITGIRHKDQSLADKLLDKEFLLTSREDGELTATFFTREYSRDDVLLCKRRTRTRT